MTSPSNRRFPTVQRYRRLGGFSVLRVFCALVVLIPLMGLIWKHHFDQTWDRVDEEMRPYIEEELRRIEEYNNSDAGRAEKEKQKRMQELARESIEARSSAQQKAVFGGEPDEEDMKALNKAAAEERKRIQQFWESAEGKKYKEEQERLQKKARDTIKN
jgi:hypothetical protein